MNNYSVGISGTGSYVPNKVLTNQDLSLMVDTNNEWIVERTGIEERRIAENHISTSDLGTEAAKKSLLDAKLNPVEIDLIIVAIVKSKDRDALVTGRSTGHPIRSLKNQFAREFINLEKSGAHIEELAKLNVGRLKLAVKTGDIINGSLMAGQISGLINEIESCKKIIESMVNMGVKTMDRLSLLKGGDNQ